MIPQGCSASSEKAMALLWKGVLRIIKNLIRSIGVFKTGSLLWLLQGK
jgi:hypothetical protein